MLKAGFRKAQHGSIGVSALGPSRGDYFSTMNTALVTSRSPSRWSERVPLAIIASVGLGISVYLSAYQLGLIAAPWDPIFGSHSSAKVLHSFLSRALPLPDAAIGAVAYAAEIILDLGGGTDRWRAHPWLVLAFAAVAFGLGLGSIGLVVVQLAILHSACTLCLCSAAASITVAIGVATGGEVAAALRAKGFIKNQSGGVQWR
jgi:uncharacterized membrane protein